MATRCYVTAAIPYVNADPHLGHALEFVQADTLARWRRHRGDEVRSLWGTDDNAPKNALAAAEAGEPTQRFVDRHAAAFRSLREPLQLGFDGFLRTSLDPRHRPAVERLWLACERAGDLYRSTYEGHYCQGCERFYASSELDGGLCPEHATVAEPVVEDNWFFRLSRYAPTILAAIESGRLRIAPEHRRNELIAFLQGEVRDLSVSRPAARAHGWGIPVPGDADQTIYIWFDALTNYLSGLGFGSSDPDHDRWWRGSDRRVHVIGKGIARFHAVFWPAFLLSAGEPLPTDVLVHEYLTVDGAKISKSAGGAVAPTDLADRFGADALRWWLLRDVAATGDTDFRIERLVQRHDEDLANGLGNLITRTIGLVRRSGVAPQRLYDGACSPEPAVRVADARERIDGALERLDTRAATAALVEVVRSANAYVNEHRPWELLDDPRHAEELERVLAKLLRTCRALAADVEPFLPAASSRLKGALSGDPSAATAFPRLERTRGGAP